MNRSTEIEALTARYMRAIQSSDAELLSYLYSHEPGTRVIGTDPREWWSGFEEFMPLWEAQLSEAHDGGGLRVEVVEVEGFENGDTGWVAGRGVFHFEGRGDVPFRMTGVLRVEHGHWRFVQTHHSVGLRNEDVLGVSFPTSLDQIHESLRIERPSLGGVAAPDGTVSILFTDLEGSTVMAERLGDAGWVEWLHSHHRVVVESAASRRGFVVKSLGDGYMLAFPSASDAIACAASIVTSSVAGDDHDPPKIRAGIHTGDAVRNVNDFYGHTVNVAARVAALAQGGEVLVTRVVRELTRGRGFKWGSERTVELKGIDEPYQVMPLELATAVGAH